MTITDVYDYITNQKECEESFIPIVELGQIDVPKNFIDDIISKKNFEEKFLHGQPGKSWEGANEWLIYVTTPRNADWFDPDFININDQITKKAREFDPGFELAAASIFSLAPGGYIVPHIDRPGNPNELYMPFNWPIGVHMAWRDYGEIHPSCNTVYAYDTSKEHAIVNMSNQIRYVYILHPKDNKPWMDIFTSNNISS